MALLLSRSINYPLCGSKALCGGGEWARHYMRSALIEANKGEFFPSMDASPPCLLRVSCILLTVVEEQPMVLHVRIRNSNGMYANNFVHTQKCQPLKICQNYFLPCQPSLCACANASLWRLLDSSVRRRWVYISLRLSPSVIFIVMLNQSSTKLDGTFAWQLFLTHRVRGQCHTHT